MPIKKEDVAEWASHEAELTGGLNSPDEPPSWKFGYIIYLKMFYEIRDKWEQATDPVKLQQLYGQMNKSVCFYLFLPLLIERNDSETPSKFMFVCSFSLAVIVLKKAEILTLCKTSSKLVRFHNFETSNGVEAALYCKAFVNCVQNKYCEARFFCLDTAKIKYRQLTSEKVDGRILTCYSNIDEKLNMFRDRLLYIFIRSCNFYKPQVVLG